MTAKRLQAVRGAVLRADRLLGRAEAMLLAALVTTITCVTFAQVIARYVFESPLIWSEEVARYLFVWIVLIGAAAAVRSNEHFGLDMLRRYMAPLRLLLGLVTMLVVGGFLGLLFYTGTVETMQASTQFSAGLPMRMHWPYLALPVGAGLALLHVIAHWVRAGAGAHPLDAVDADA